MKNILLDLDNTIISSISKAEECKSHKPRMKLFKYEDMDGYYTVFERPGLQKFLDYLFKHFNVSIWTAASKTYALFIIDKFILKDHPKRKLDYILFSHHCKESNEKYKTQKSLKMLEKMIENYDLKSTYIIDDHPDVYKAQPENCIQIEEFDFKKRRSYEDNKLEGIITRLEELRD